MDEDIQFRAGRAEALKIVEIHAPMAQKIFTHTLEEFPCGPECCGTTDEMTKASLEEALRRVKEDSAKEFTVTFTGDILIIRCEDDLFGVVSMWL